MSKKIRVREIMSANPITLECSATAQDAAKAMRSANVGAILVQDQGKLSGIITDRDLAVRVMAVDKPSTTRLDGICSGELTTVSPEDDARVAVELMRSKGIRRIPVQDDGKPVGILSLGDLALERDPKSALGAISAAFPNR